MNSVISLKKVSVFAITVVVIAIVIKFMPINHELITGDTVKVSGFIYGASYECDNQDVIKNFVGIINNAKKQRMIPFRETCDSPEMILKFYDSDGQEKTLRCYGDYLVYESKQYKINSNELHRQLIWTVNGYLT